VTVLTDELVDEETDGDDVEDEQVEDVLTVLLQEVCPNVPFPVNFLSTIRAR